jgi:putative phage-type endonuclease
MISSLPIFPFLGLDIVHKDGVNGVIIRPDKNRVRNFIVRFEDGVESSQNASSLILKNKKSLNHYLPEEAISADLWFDIVNGNVTLKSPMDKESKWQYVVSRLSHEKLNIPLVTKILRYQDGNTYEGTLKNNKFHGKGVLTLANGDICEGDFRNGKLHGSGSYFFVGGLKYWGQFLRGKRSGIGKYVWPHGDVYEGECWDDQINGIGTYTYADGHRYVGHFLNSKKNGNGKGTWLSGASYEGVWVNDQFNGQGTYIYGDGRQYTGEWKNGECNGLGRFITATGDTYQGFLKDGKFEGLGIYTFADGRSYEGAWIANKYCGQGVFKDATGKILFEGRWENGKLVESTKNQIQVNGPIKKVAPRVLMGFSRVNFQQGSKDWLRWRKMGIGASDAPVIMGENPWKSAKYLLEEKLGKKKEWGGNDATQNGQKNEPVIRQYLVNKLGFEIHPYCIESNEINWMKASLDGISNAGDRVFEIKFGKKVYADVSKTKIVPKYHYGQLQHILAITGLSFIDYCCGWDGEQPIHFQVPRDDDYINKLIEAEHLFWKMVVENR